MDTGSAQGTNDSSLTMDVSDETTKGLATMDEATNLASNDGVSHLQDDHFSENSSSSKRVKLDARSTVVSKTAVAKMIQDQNSPLTEANLRASFGLLSSRTAFDCLKPDQKESLMAMLPSRNTTIDQFGNRRPSEEFLLSNPDWAQNIGAFQDDLREGRWDPQWIAEALEAHQQRQAGSFDEYKEGEFESFWGQRQKLSSNVVAGMSSDVKLGDLFRRDTLKVGDIWSFARTFGKKSGGPQILVEKEIVITDVKASQATVIIPTGQAKLSRPGHENVVLANITGPGQVVTAILETDGRVKDPPNGNAWKSIRVLRNNQDLGTLWDIRQAYHFRDREGEYKSAVNGIPYRNHRAAVGQVQQGLFWANPFTVVFQQLRLANNSQQPPATLQIPPKFHDALNRIALPGATLFRVDYRVMIKDGLPVPSQSEMEDSEHDGIDREWVDRMLQVGPAVFPTPFTRSLALEHGPSWSLGHAHLGSDALGAVWSATPGKIGKANSNARHQQIWDPLFDMIPIPITQSQRHSIICLLKDNPSWIPQYHFIQTELLYRDRSNSTEPGASWQRPLKPIQPRQVDEVSSTALHSMTGVLSESQSNSFLNWSSVPISGHLLNSNTQSSVNQSQAPDTANPPQVQQIDFFPSAVPNYDENGNLYYDSYCPIKGWYRTIYPPTK